MLRSRVLPPGFRLFAGYAALALVAASVFGVGSNLANSDQGLMESLIGPLSAGWMGGVGSQVGYAVLVGMAICAAAVAGIIVAFRDADPEAQAEIVPGDSVPLTSAPVGASYAPLAGALAGVGLIVGAAASTELFMASAFVLVAVAFVWTTRAWANRATGDAETNLELYARLMEPLRIPILAAVCTAFVVVGLSRAFLAVPAVGSVVVLAVIATLFLLGSALVAARPSLSREAVVLVLVVAAVAILGAAIVGLIAGPREFHDYSQEHSISAEVAPTAIEPPSEGPRR